MEKSIKKSIQTNSKRETQQLAGKFSQDLLLRPKKSQGAFVVGLQGDLGSGKTTFIQGFARGLGIKEKVLSPTFVIVKAYKIPDTRYKIQNLYHIDCYRIKDEYDLLSLGWDKIVSDPKNLVLIEWSDRIRKILPKDTISISFATTTEHQRAVTFS